MHRSASPPAAAGPRALPINRLCFFQKKTKRRGLSACCRTYRGKFPSAYLSSFIKHNPVIAFMIAHIFPHVNTSFQFFCEKNLFFFRFFGQFDQLTLTYNTPEGLSPSLFPLCTLLRQLFYAIFSETFTCFSIFCRFMSILSVNYEGYFLLISFILSDRPEKGLLLSETHQSGRPRGKRGRPTQMPLFSPLPTKKLCRGAHFFRAPCKDLL